MDADIKARLVQAAEQIARERGFVPESEEAMDEFLVANAAAIGQRAIDLQLDMFVKFKQHQEQITRLLSASIYHEIRRTHKVDAIITSLDEEQFAKY